MFLKKKTSKKTQLEILDNEFVGTNAVKIFLNSLKY
jgi:hypothetical protein